MTNPKLILVDNYNSIRKIPDGTYFCFFTGWIGAFDDDAKPYLLCHKTGAGQMAWVVCGETDTAEHAKHALMKLITQAENGHGK